MRKEVVSDPLLCREALHSGSDFAQCQRLRLTSRRSSFWRVSLRLRAPRDKPGPHSGRRGFGPPRLSTECSWERAPGGRGRPARRAQSDPGPPETRSRVAGEERVERGGVVWEQWRRWEVGGGAAGNARGLVGPVGLGARWRGGTGRRRAGLPSSLTSSWRRAPQRVPGRGAGRAGLGILGPPSPGPESAGSGNDGWSRNGSMRAGAAAPRLRTRGQRRRPCLRAPWGRRGASWPPGVVGGAEPGGCHGPPLCWGLLAWCAWL